MFIRIRSRRRFAGLGSGASVDGGGSCSVSTTARSAPSCQASPASQPAVRLGPLEVAKFPYHAGGSPSSPVSRTADLLPSAQNDTPLRSPSGRVWYGRLVVDDGPPCRAAANGCRLELAVGREAWSQAVKTSYRWSSSPARSAERNVWSRPKLSVGTSSPACWRWTEMVSATGSTSQYFRHAVSAVERQLLAPVPISG